METYHILVFISLSLSLSVETGNIMKGFIRFVKRNSFHQISMQYNYLGRQFKNIISLGCSSLSVTNSRVTYSQDQSNGVYRPNTKSTASCNNGYEKKWGWTTRTCQSSGNWDGWILECKRSNLQLYKYMPLPPKCKFIVFLNKIHHRHVTNKWSSVGSKTKYQWTYINYVVITREQCSCLIFIFIFIL